MAQDTPGDSSLSALQQRSTSATRELLLLKDHLVFRLSFPTCSVSDFDLWRCDERVRNATVISCSEVWLVALRKGAFPFGLAGLGTCGS